MSNPVYVLYEVQCPGDPYDERYVVISAGGLQLIRRKIEQSFDRFSQYCHLHVDVYVNGTWQRSQYWKTAQEYREGPLAK